MSPTPETQPGVVIDYILPSRKNILNPMGNILQLSKLHRLRVDFFHDSRLAFNAFVHIDRERVAELMVTNTSTVIREELRIFVSTFPNIQRLYISEVDGSTSSYYSMDPILQPPSAASNVAANAPTRVAFWQFFRDLKRQLARLESVTVYTKLTLRDMQTQDLGNEFVTAKTNKYVEGIGWRHAINLSFIEK
ncbi:hypothetical protein ABW20_dc0102131 [Dactylellina cionopaga]|nr:hypothetical protein ABW20_dc0102131 [Dactylellina cionopaga]